MHSALQLRTNFQKVRLGFAYFIDEHAQQPEKTTNILHNIHVYNADSRYYGILQGTYRLLFIRRTTMNVRGVRCRQVKAKAY